MSIRQFHIVIAIYQIIISHPNSNGSLAKPPLKL